MTPYQITPAADADLDAQAEHLARAAGIDTALRFLDAATITFEDIARLPGIGEPYESRNPRLAGLRVRRVEGFDKHLVFYRQADHEIQIIRVLHGARDLGELLRS